MCSLSLSMTVEGMVWDKPGTLLRAPFCIHFSLLNLFCVKTADSIITLFACTLGMTAHVAYRRKRNNLFVQN